MHKWIVSDLHLFHDNIVEYAGRPKNHTGLIIENWRKTVRQGDTVLNLGDVLMGRRDLWPTIGWLPGLVDVLNTGNHDEPHKKEWITHNLSDWNPGTEGSGDLYKPRTWQFIPEFSIEYRGWTILFSHHPEWTEPRAKAEDNTDVVFAPKVRPPKTLNVHGHIHQREDPSPYHINVSVERINYSPVNLKDLLDKRIDLLDNR